ncbi:hypothetical protein CO053_04400 [Candidatus Shapirobacteria bacterium CG_4_9_14_0_2_um_filter_40_11]|uniref:Leucine-binding protein domain-containing protein n=1 Tax=Candidatus Shapirobacteria bacterium CG_4_9_14_0_2_um_filter_40_11 TaxID=1974876 RepID=A0A2M8ETP6_9BACT|nr:MAG: hypothetical protein CO053_04400 [Candidatus Shapirobacteria bacterium CG_4_9_14_0_2_um_filter_40_11]
MKKIWIGITIVVLVALAILLFITQTKKEPQEIKIGAILPLTGDAALYGESIKKGIDLGVMQINEAGGIQGKKISILYEDSRALPADGVSAIRKLIDIHKVPVIIGDAVSSVTLAIAPIAEKNKVVLFSPLSSAPAITNAGDFIFRNVPSDLFQGKVAAYFSVKDQAWHSLAILYINNDYGVGLRDTFSNVVEALGGKIVASEAYEQGSADFRTQLSKIKEANPQAVFVVGYREAAQILIQAKEIGLKAKILGTGLFEDPGIIKVTKDAAEEVFYTIPQYTSDSPEPKVREFVKAFKEKHGSEPDIIAAYGYESMNVLHYALAKSKLTSDSIKEELYKIKDFEGVTGKISFDENGDIIQPMGVKIIKEGKPIWYKKEVSLE